jgi:membrane-associated phospholipid phosphatase
MARLSTRVFGGSLAAVALATALSYVFVDRPVALFFYRLALTHDELKQYTENIPDLLGPVVLGLTACAWVAYLWRSVQGARDRHAGFFRLSGTCIPAAFAAKTLLKTLFGRTGVKEWLTGSAPDTFHWLHGGGAFDAFPSGHMTVFSALATALWLYYPEFRGWWVAAIGLLAAALIATDYHFVSDVLAGAYLGVLVCLSIHRAYAQAHPRAQEVGDVG